MNIKTFKGSFFEIGRQQGEIYKAKGMSFGRLKIDAALYKKQLQIYEKYYPELLEEFRGMATGGPFDEKKLTYEFVTDELRHFRNEPSQDKACTIFGYKTKRNLFVGRNYDWLPETEKLFEVYRVLNLKRNSFLAVTDMGVSSPATAKPKYLFYNADDAINDKGLFIGLTFAYADQWSYGLSCIHMTKLVAETCRTVKEAIRVFEKTPLCYPKNFFIADKNGDMAIIEHNSKKLKVIYPKDGLLIQTNHYVDAELAQKDTVLKRVPFHNTFIRYYETLQKINSDKPNRLGNVIKILGSPNTYTCQNLPGTRTIWTLALEMTHKKYKIYWDLFGERKVKNLSV